MTKMVNGFNVEQLMNSDLPYERGMAILVTGGEDDEVLDKLVYDDSWLVRVKVATIGRPQDLDKLVYDPEPRVRGHVARHGRPQDLELLRCDDDASVKLDVLHFNRPEDLEIMAEDFDPLIATEAKRALRGLKLLAE